MIANLKGTITKPQRLAGDIKTGANGVTKYEQLPDKPRIENVELVGNKTFAELGMVECLNQDIEDMFK